jgi:hypothetical protein
LGAEDGMAVFCLQYSTNRIVVLMEVTVFLLSQAGSIADVVLYINSARVAEVQKENSNSNPGDKYQFPSMGVQPTVLVTILHWPNTL